MFVIKHTWGTHSAAPFDQLTFFFFFFLTGSVFTGFFFFLSSSLGSASSLGFFFFFFFLSSSLGLVFFTGFLFFSFFFFFFSLGSGFWVLEKKKKKSCIVTSVGPPKSVKNSEWWKPSDGTKQPWYLEWWVMEIEWQKKVNQIAPKFLKVDTLKLYIIICEHQQYNFQNHNI